MIFSDTHLLSGYCTSWSLWTKNVDAESNCGCFTSVPVKTHNVHLTHSIATSDGFFGFKRQKLDEDTVDPLGSVRPTDYEKTRI
ncbi:hypothetical protein CRE_25858 [Caenorhabditis remanei]|uniref:Uncharacterized protein n=1 Tax=Caenorhabditis remanei TaxID=31234 RepID=E3NDR7_CAERE|nr:hypothetical protein CRE_25858 [Caenorhabditis remanei]